ncbi:hypothetical protein EOI86_06025 [Hwanghaeella grinnelliae]|uniref:Uncharacterized protein n=1 Tax=Hwanghaeella grinnelliae TaxID=2500179 RepID=A0A3S3URD7_9PROT|nr:hypothetical protein [Hwanghaeella grinnelliae]RVU38823.1 hypothetical protein EOI86_06025 [Hwanghaeella grinnelliae]
MHAELVNADWRIAGDKLLTRDTETGLEWLNVEQTYRRSKADVSQLFGIDQEFEGFRFARLDEYQTLLKNAGIPLTFDRAEPSNNFFAGEVTNAKAALTLMDLIGYSVFMFKRGAPDDGHRRLHGVLEDGFSPILETFQPIDAITGENDGGLRARLSAAVLEDHQVGVDVGMFLVREAIVSAVPKRSSLAMLTLGSTLFAETCCGRMR